MVHLIFFLYCGGVGFYGVEKYQKKIVVEESNLTDYILNHVGKDLHRKNDHPLNTIKGKMFDYWNSVYDKPFTLVDNLEPVVSTKQSFDDLLIPENHVSRAFTDTYYFDKSTILRPHTSAHQVDLMKSGINQFLVVGDCYRRDTIDITHYPVFHQMEGVKIFSDEELQGVDDVETHIINDMKAGLEGMAKVFYGDVQMRWNEDYFPFTHPSLELEIFFNGEWMEVLGSGKIHPGVMKNAGIPDKQGWAFGIGIERMAMMLFNIPDIRLFWSEDERFTTQFSNGKITKFNPFSKFPPCKKDISFFINENFHENEFYELVRSVAGDLVENVELIDNFTMKDGRTSHCYRIMYRSMNRNLTNEEIDAIQETVRAKTSSALSVELR